MSGTAGVQVGYDVYGGDQQLLGRVDAVRDDGFALGDRWFSWRQVERVEGRRVYLSGAGVTREEAARVPVAEERLSVEKRQAERGAVEIQRTVRQERQTIPLDVMREEVRISRRDIPDRPLSVAEAAVAFSGGTIRVPVRAEEVLVNKEAVVTGEVIIHKERTVERREVTETVRKQQVDVDERYAEARPEFERHFAGRQATDLASAGSFEQAEPRYRAGYLAGSDERYAGREFADVEPDLRRDHERTGVVGDDTWTRLREEIREGWNRARGQG